MAIRASINLGLSLTLDESFPNIIPVPRPVIKDQEIIDPHWFVGFTEGEGCFLLDIFKSKTHNIGYQVRLKFQVTQHSRDIVLMNSLIKYLDCGVLREYSRRPAVDFVVTKFSIFILKLYHYLLTTLYKGSKAWTLLIFVKLLYLLRTMII